MHTKAGPRFCQARRRRFITVQAISRAIENSLPAVATACGMLCADTLPAHAQSCTTSGTSPYQTCTTWQGPQLIPSSIPGGTHSQYTWGPLQPFDLTGAGIGGFMQNWGVQLALNAGSSFTTQAPPINGYRCYMGNFDGSGRSGIACPVDAQINYSLSNGTSLGTVINEPLPSGNYTQVQFISPFDTNANIGNVVDPCLVMDVDGDGTDDIVCGGSVLPTYDNPAGALNNNWGIYRWNGNGFTYSVWTSPGVYSVGFTCIQGQFGGDGLGGLACHQTAGSSTWAILHSTGNGWSVENWTGGPVPSVGGTGGDTGYISFNAPTCPQGDGFTNLTCIIAPSCSPGVDLNGDGVTDLVCSINPSGTTNGAVGFSGSAGAFKSLLPFADSVFQPDVFMAITDLYGTGLAGPFVNYGQGSAQWTFSAATFPTGGGISFASTSFTLSFAVGTAPPSGAAAWGIDNSCVIEDLNGDGIEDIACQLPAGISGNGTWNVALSTRPQ